MVTHSSIGCSRRKRQKLLQLHPIRYFSPSTECQTTTESKETVMKHGIWSEDEHDRFLLAIKEYPRGPWGCIASAVGTRSVRQVQTHTQKYYEKIMRRVRGLRKKDRRTWARVEHRIDDDILNFCDFMKSTGSNKVIASDPYALANVAVSPSSSTSSSPCTSPVQFRLSLDESSSEPEEVTKAVVGNFSDLPQLDLPPLEEALDFFIKIMEQ